MAKYFDFMHIPYMIYDMQHKVFYTLMIVSQKSHPNEEKFQFPAHFQFTKFSKFRFSYTSPKYEELNFRGRLQGDFVDPRMFCTP